MVSFSISVDITLEGIEDVLDIRGFPALNYFLIHTCCFIPAYKAGLSPQDAVIIRLKKGVKNLPELAREKRGEPCHLQEVSMGLYTIYI